MGCLLDLGVHTVSYTLNGRDLGVAFALPEHCRYVCDTLGVAHYIMECVHGLGAFDGAPDDASTSSSSALAAGWMEPVHACRGGKQALYPALTLKDAAAAVNFGACPFRAGPPAGFVGIGSAAAAAFVTAGAVCPYTSGFHCCAPQRLLVASEL